MITVNIKYWKKEGNQDPELVDHEVCIPENWGEISWGAYEELANLAIEEMSAKDRAFKMLSIVTGFDKWGKSDENIMTPILSRLQWLFNAELDLNNIPECLEYDGRTFNVKQKLSNATADQIWSIQDLGQSVVSKFKDEENVPWKVFFHLFTKVLGILFQPHIDGTFPETNQARQAELEGEFNALPCTVIGPIGCFFLKKHLGFGENGGSGSKASTSPKKNKRGLESLKSLVRS